MSCTNAMTLYTVSVLLVLGVGNVVGTIPKPLLIVSGAFFLVWTIFFWFINRWTVWSAIGLVLRTFITWLAITICALVWLYRWDRAGWLWSTVSGYDTTVAESFSGAADLDVFEFVRQKPIFRLAADDPSKLTLPSGTYQIDKTIVVPRGTTLTIAAGTTLRFGVGCSLISYGSIIAVGLEDKPIVFTAQSKWRKWGAVGIVNSDSSVFDYTIFENGRHALVNGLEFTGCLSLYASEARITNSRFLNLFGKDAVNVRQGRVLIRDNVFENTFKDGLDLDGGSGEVSHNRFVDCGDEGIDLSENDQLKVHDNQIIDSRGGRLAAESNVEQIRAQNTLLRHEI